ncbi:CDP-diacylglycerol--glycerol-3-phosphate 3-phosphatidyltransferase, partial [Campylobacter jejuni]|nr:CDP-diacylglycerol--glycerol-3-phosphate 3-phosphatidyltransferase [Campylobacter jejuni]
MNLPNILAIFRMVLAPLLFFLLIHHFENIHQSWINYFAALTFSLAALSDFFDGYIARTWKQTTKLGGILDPLADKMLVLAAFLGLLLTGKANEWVI